MARYAAELLTKAQVRVTLRTYGTPHFGTALADGGRRAFKALVASGRAMVNAIPSWDPATMAGKFLLGTKFGGDFPPGLDVMSTTSKELAMFNRLCANAFPFKSFGGFYDLRLLADGACDYAFGEVMAGGFHGEKNDLVVETASALGVGTPQLEMSPCSHFSYFAQSAVLSDIRSLQ